MTCLKSLITGLLSAVALDGVSGVPAADSRIREIVKPVGIVAQAEVVPATLDYIAATTKAEKWTNNACRIDEMPAAGKNDIHGDYGEFCYKGFRHSLCHGWSSGPAAWCINHVLGIRPMDVGCKTVEVKPFLGDLDWAEGAMALPNGESIRVRIGKAECGGLAVDVSAPEWVDVRR